MQLCCTCVSYGNYPYLRYDCRGHLYDKNQFGLKPNLPHRWTAEEEDFEEMLDRERYMALNEDLREEDFRKGGH